MNFKESYQKYLQGTATPEEERYVEQILEKGERIFNMVDEMPEEKSAQTEVAAQGAQEPQGILAKAKRGAMQKISGLGAALVRVGGGTEKIRTAEDEEIRRMKKRLFKKTVVTTAIIAAIVLVLLAAAAAGIIFGIALPAANERLISDADIDAYAISFVQREGLVPAGEAVFVTDKERDLELEFDLKRSYFEYEVDLVTAGGEKIGLIINTKTGTVLLRQYRKD